MSAHIPLALGCPDPGRALTVWWGEGSACPFARRGSCAWLPEPYPTDRSYKNMTSVCQRFTQFSCLSPAVASEDVTEKGPETGRILLKGFFCVASQHLSVRDL